MVCGYKAYGLCIADIFGALDVDDFGSKLFMSGRGGEICGLDEVGG